ncbi:hypothetical protein L682_00165 [Aquipseudomonas alcaligenes OT 69]|nr:hypothetical protein L682_00165 [Pseudomonas alcaligenes OT 69]
MGIRLEFRRMAQQNFHPLGRTEYQVGIEAVGQKV